MCNRQLTCLRAIIRLESSLRTPHAPKAQFEEKQESANCVNKRTELTVQCQQYLFSGRDEAADFAEVHRVWASVVAILDELQDFLQTGIGVMESDWRARRPEKRPVEILTQPEH